MVVEGGGDSGGGYLKIMMKRRSVSKPQ